LAICSSLLWSNKRATVNQKTVYSKLQGLGLLPGELLPSEVSVASGLVVDGLPEIELLDDVSGAEVEVLLDDVKDLSVALLASSVGVNVDGKGISNTNSIRELDKASPAELGSHKGLGDPAGSISGRAIDLGPVLSREGSSSVGSPTSVGVDDDLSSGDSGISLGSSDHELSRTLDVEDSVLVHVLGGDDGIDDLGLEKLSLLLKGDLGTVLGGDDDGVDALGDGGAIVKLVLNGDLGLGVGAEPAELSAAPELGHLHVELVGEHEGEGHELGGLVGGIAEHDTLISGSGVLDLALNVDSLGDIGGLLLDGDEDVAGVVVESLLGVVVSDVVDGITDDPLVVELGLGGDLSEDHDHSGLGGGLAGDLGELVLLEAGIKDGIRDLIADLVCRGKDGRRRGKKRRKEGWVSEIWKKIGKRKEVRGQPGCPSPTDSEVKRKVSLTMLKFLRVCKLRRKVSLGGVSSLLAN